MFEQESNHENEAAKDFIQEMLNKNNIEAILGKFFDTNASTAIVFFDALKTIISEESNRFITSDNNDHESHKIYMENLASHQKFIENILNNLEESDFDKTELLKMLRKILEDMKEERNAQRTAKEKKEDEERKETTKRIAIGGVIAAAGLFALTLVLNKGNVSKTLEQTGEVLKDFTEK